MSRENRFSDTSSNFSSRRRLSVEKVKEIFIQNVTNGDKRSLNIIMKKTVKDLKKEIEKLFGLDSSLDDISLRVQTSSINGQTLIPPKDEQKSLFDNGFTPICEVFFGKDESVGGTFNSFK